MMSSCMVIVEGRDDKLVLYNSQLRNEPEIIRNDALKHLKIGDWVRVGMYSNLSIAYIDPIPIPEPPLPTRIVDEGVQILTTVHFPMEERPTAESDDFGLIGVRKPLRQQEHFRGQTMKAWCKRLSMDERQKLAENTNCHSTLNWGVIESMSETDKVRLGDKYTLDSRKGEHAMAASASEALEGGAGDSDWKFAYSLHNNIGVLIDDFNALKLGSSAKFEQNLDDTGKSNDNPANSSAPLSSTYLSVPCPPEKYRMRYGLVTNVRAYETSRVAFVWSPGCYPVRHGKLSWKKGTLVEGQWIRFYTRPCDDEFFTHTANWTPPMKTDALSETNYIKTAGDGASNCSITPSVSPLPLTSDTQRRFPIHFPEEYDCPNGYDVIVHTRIFRLRLINVCAMKYEHWPPSFACIEQIGVVYDPDQLLRQDENQAIVLEMMTKFDQYRLNTIWMVNSAVPVQTEFIRIPGLSGYENYLNMDSISVEYPPEELPEDGQGYGHSLILQGQPLIASRKERSKRDRSIKDRIIEHLRNSGHSPNSLTLSTFFLSRIIDGEYQSGNNVADGLFQAKAVVECTSDPLMFIWCYDQMMPSTIKLAEYGEKLKVGECFEAYFIKVTDMRVPRVNGKVTYILRCVHVVKTVYPPFVCFDKNGRLHVRVRAKFCQPTDFINGKAVAFNEQFGPIVDYMQIMDGKPIPKDPVYVTACKVKIHLGDAISFVWGFYKVTSLTGIELAVSRRPSFGHNTTAPSSSNGSLALPTNSTGRSGSYFYGQHQTTQPSMPLVFKRQNANIPYSSTFQAEQ